MSTAHETETEVKIRVSDVAAAKGRLDSCGLVVSVPRRFESNTVYDTDDLALKSADMLLRLRSVGDESIITWKGPTIGGDHKIRRELETSVGSLETLAKILHALGYEPSFRYEKYRTEYQHAGMPDGTVTLDETPIGDFLELEGPADWIDRIAELLGFRRSDYVLLSYVRLYLKDCAAKGIEPSNMVFPAAR